MSSHRFLTIILLLLCFVFASHTKDIPNCKFEDTVDLTDALRYANGSYLYDENVIIPADQVAIYDYEEIFRGKRVPHEPHPRGCLCKDHKCVKFCCDPIKEGIFNNTRECGSLPNDLKYDVSIDVTYPNGSIYLTDLRKHFTVIRGIPCENAFSINGVYRWTLYENGSLWMSRDHTLLSRRDYCLSPVEDSDGNLVLSPLDCLVLDDDGHDASDVIGYIGM